MEGWQLAILLKPLGLLGFLFLVALIAFPIRRLVRLAFPNSVLADPTFRDRRPYLFTFIVIMVYVCMISFFAYFAINHL